MYGPKHHILATVQPAWEQIEATFGSKFWPLYLANLLTTQQAGQTDWGPLSNRWTGNVHFSLFSIFWSSSTQRRTNLIRGDFGSQGPCVSVL